MVGGTHKIAVLKDVRDEQVGDDTLDLHDFVIYEQPEVMEPLTDWRGRAIDAGFFVALIGWIAGVAYAFSPRWTGTLPPPDTIVVHLAILFAPLAFLVTAYALVTRNSRNQGNAVVRASAVLRAEQARLDTTLAHVTARIATEQNELAATNDRLMLVGEDAAHRLKMATEAMREEIDTLSRYGHALKFSATSARADVAVLLSDLPKAQLETRQMVAALQEAGVTAHERAGTLDALLASLTVRGREADEIAGGAAQKLAAHMSRIESVSEVAGTRLEDAATRMTDAIDAALERAAEAGDTARRNMDAQGAAMRALVDQTEAALVRTGNSSADAIAARVDDLTDRLESLGALLDSQSTTTMTLLDNVRDGLDGIDTRFVTLDEGGVARADRLSAALAKLDGHTATLTGALGTGTTAADALIARAETLMTSLDASVREIDETLPAAFDRLEAKSAAAGAKVTEAAPLVTQLERDASTALDRLMEAESLVTKHRAALGELGSEAEKQLVRSQKAATDLLVEVRAADETTRALAEGVGAQLVEALVRVRETAQSAADRAREAIAAVIPEAAGKLSDSAREALARVITEQVQAHIAELATTAEQAVETAHKASDKLMRQMLTIAETSTSLDARIVETRTEFENSDRDNFARRVALLIESLNSTAIDVTKILASDVTDSAWAAYLRGDRGIFTRRAVRLLDSGQAREVLRHYEGDPEFREQVNRYIHDFEAMLRTILSTRDGSSLGVTLLSSDMGKLYVALAQSIERLRT